MQQPSESDGDEDKADNKVNRRFPHWASIALWIVGALALLALIIGGLCLTSYYVSYGTDPVSFVTANLLNALIFAAIVAQVLIYRKQWHVMEQQWQESHKMIELMARSECAYVTVSGWELPANVTNGLVVTAVFLNAGRTPALDLKRTIQVAVGEGHPPVGWGRIDWDAIPHDMTEGITLEANRDVKLSNEPLEIPPSILAEINSGKQFIVMDGQCRYFDILGGLQIYEFGMTVELGPPPRALIRYQEHTRKKAEADNPN